MPYRFSIILIVKEWIVINIGHENARLARALRDKDLRERLMTEYARRSKAYAWAALLQICLGGVFWLMSNGQPFAYVSLAVALLFLIICLRVRWDRRRLQFVDDAGRD
jgi:hypothetical protein